VSNIREEVSAPSFSGHVDRTPSVWVVVASILVGALLPIQARLNGELAHRWGVGLAPPLVSFGSGWLITSVVVVCWLPARRGLRRLVSSWWTGRIPRWFVIAGTLGTVLVLCQGLGLGYTGVAIFTITVIAGQAVSGLVIDARGVAGVARRPASRRRMAGVGLVLLGAALSVVPSMLSTRHLWQMSVAVAAYLVGGLCIGLQQAINGTVGRVATSVMAATWVSFGVGTLFLALVCGISVLLFGGWELTPEPPWLFLGGLLGVVFVASASWLVQRGGALLFALSATAGQLGASLGLDAFLPSAGRPIEVGSVLAAVIVLAAVVLTAQGPKRSAARS
jgi:bacterial/archaeal transporter family-2 protein